MTFPIKILIVDDIEENRLILKKMCKSFDEVLLYEAANGEEAVEAAQKERPHIVLMDIMMPVMDGFEATKRIKDLIPETIIVVVTALSDSETETKMVHSGANAYLTKPLDRELTRFKLLNFIRIIRNQNRLHTITKQAALNPFSKSIRSMKTLWYINNENDLMDFGSWLIELYARHQDTHTFGFDTKLEILYKVIQNNLNLHQTLTLVIEDGFENLYISFVNRDGFDPDPVLQEKIGAILDDIVFKDHFIHIRIWLVSADRQAAHKTETATAVLDNDIQTEEKIRRKIQEEEKDILRKSYTDKVTAKEYVVSLGDVLDELQDIAEIEEEWKNYLEEFKYEQQIASLHAVATEISRYSSVINSLYDFMALAYSMSTLALFLENITQEKLDESKITKLYTVLGLILEDLVNWRETIFVKQETNDIHYLDSSLFSSCLQVETIMTDAAIEQNDDDDDIEFF